MEQMEADAAEADAASAKETNMGRKGVSRSQGHPPGSAIGREGRDASDPIRSIRTKHQHRRQKGHHLSETQFRPPSDQQDTLCIQKDMQEGEPSQIRNYTLLPELP
jgi:hypothetical protein